MQGGRAMKISIIVPFCNTPQNMLEELVNQLSKLNSTLFEIIFVNDGSNKTTNEFAEKLLNKFVYVKLDSNKGVSNARNVGIQKSSGEYLFFVDSDDLLNLDLVRMLPEMTHDDLSIFISDIFYTTIADDKSNLNEIDTDGNKLDYFYAFSNIKGIAMRSACGKLFKKSILLENNILFDTELPFYEDAMFVSRYYQCTKKFHVYSNVIYHYRMNQNSYSKKFTKNYMEKFELFYKKYKTNYGNNPNFLYGLQSDTFNNVLVAKVIFSFKKLHYLYAIKIAKNDCVIESANSLLSNNQLNSKYKIKLASLIVNRHNILATNKIIAHQIFGSLKTRFKRLVGH